MWNIEYKLNTAMVTEAVYINVISICIITWEHISQLMERRVDDVSWETKCHVSVYVVAWYVSN